MPRAINGTVRKNRRKKYQKLAKGFWGRRKNLHRTTKDAVAKALLYAYRDRRAKKREFRSLWIARISAAARQHGMNYSSFMNALKQSGIEINRKVLSNMLFENPDFMKTLLEKSKVKP